MASMKVNKKTVSRWGIFDLKKKLVRNNYLIKDVVEKPSVSSAPSNKAVIGRYILPKKIFSKLSKQKPGKGGEIHITDAIQSLINDNHKFIAHNFFRKILRLWKYAWLYQNQHWRLANYEIMYDRHRICWISKWCMFSDLGNDVICVDKDLDKINLLKKGQVPIYEPGFIRTCC